MLRIDLLEVTFLQPRRRIPEGPFAVNARHRLLKKAWIEVRPQDRHLPMPQIRQDPVEQNGDGVGLLSGATSRAPDAKTALRILPQTRYFRQDLLGKNFKAPLFPEEIGLSHG